MRVDQELPPPPPPPPQPYRPRRRSRKAIIAIIALLIIAVFIAILIYLAYKLGIQLNYGGILSTAILVSIITLIRSASRSKKSRRRNPRIKVMDY